MIAAALTQAGSGQGAKRPAPDKGPRAIGLIELPAKGKPHLAPVAIMIDGEFYDASAYKAAPVPMALQWGTVYEAERTGVSLGLFTVTAALESQDQTWIAEGTWQSEDEIRAKAAKAAAKKHGSSKPRGWDEEEGPPKLRRATPSGQSSGDGKTSETSSKPLSETQSSTGSATQSSPSQTTTQSSPSRASAGPLTTPSSSNGPTSTSTPSSSGLPSTASAGTSASNGAGSSSGASTAGSVGQSSSSGSVTSQSNSQATATAPDAGHPTLHRGKPSAPELEKEAQDDATAGTSKASASGTTLSSGIRAKTVATSDSEQMIPAISDAHGAEPRAYTYILKPDEEKLLRQKILALAEVEVRAREEKSGANTQQALQKSKPAARSKTTKPAGPDFENVQLRVFDLFSSNEPELVLTATAKIPQAAGSASPERQYLLTIVAHEDIYGDLHKALAVVTDSQHLDVVPRLELVDAVDADGDGRGELLFRRVSDTGSAYVIYRVIGDQLWALFEGTIQ
jgi:hypothetical protein